MDARAQSDNPDDVRYAMDETRAQLSETARQLSEAVSERTEAVRERVASARERLDVTMLVQRHPWPAIGLALGVGLAMATSGADRAALDGTTTAARRVSRATGDIVRRRRERSRHEQESATGDGSVRHGLVERIAESILGAINVDGLLTQLRHAGGNLTGRPDNDVSRNRLAQHGYWK